MGNGRIVSQTAGRIAGGPDLETAVSRTHLHGNVPRLIGADRAPTRVPDEIDRLWRRMTEPVARADTHERELRPENEEFRGGHSAAAAVVSDLQHIHVLEATGVLRGVQALPTPRLP